MSVSGGTSTIDNFQETNDQRLAKAMTMEQNGENLEKEWSVAL